MIKSASFLLQAILVILAVLLFSYLDPFGIFGSKKQTLVDTPITVSSIKEIGKFISAEYYGEVLSSLNEIYIEKLENNTNEMGRLDSIFRDAMQELHANDSLSKRKNKRLDYFHANYTEITEHPLYNTYIEYLQEKKKIRKEKNLLDELIDDPKSLEKFDAATLAKLSKDSRDLFAANKKILKQQIVLLGRGWVKAGFNFDKFTSENFKYVSSTRSIYLLGMKPEILSCTINPWFIPEKKVKGFELIVYTGKANDPKLINQVKEDCLRKLRQSAMEQNILGKAEENAKLNLKAFFNLLVEGGIENVFFVDDSLDVLKSELFSDSLIRGDELAMIDTILARAGTGSFDSIKVKTFIDAIRNMKFYLKEKPSTLTCYSSFVYNVISDQAVDSMELIQLKNMKNNLASPYPHEVFWFALNDSTKEATRRKWFDLAVDEIAGYTNQFIVSPAQSKILTRNNREKEKSDTAAIAGIFRELKN